MQTIKRDIYVTKNVLQAPIEVTEGTNSIAIEFDVRDYDIPASAAAVAYSLSTSSMEEPNKALADVSGNKITIIPSETFFLPGQNVMQVRIIDGNSKLISFNIIVKCTGKMRFGDEKEAQQSTLVEQMLAKLGEYQKKSASPYNFKGSCLSSALPTSGNKINDTYYCTDLKYRKTWNGSTWEQSSLNEADYEDELTKTNGEVSSLKEDIHNMQTFSDKSLSNFEWEIGTINTENGANANNTKRLRTKDYISVNTGDRILALNGYQMLICVYDSSKTFLYSTPIFTKDYTLLVDGYIRVASFRFDGAVVIASDLTTIPSNMFVRNKLINCIDSTIENINSTSQIELSNFEWEIGTINTENGANANNTKRLRTKDYIEMKKGDTLIDSIGDSFIVFLYDSTKAFLSSEIVYGKYKLANDYFVKTVCYRRDRKDIEAYDLVNIPKNMYLREAGKGLYLEKISDKIESLESKCEENKEKVIYCGSSRKFKTLKSAIEYAVQFKGSTVCVDAEEFDLLQEFGNSYFENLTTDSQLNGIALYNDITVHFASGSKVKCNYEGNNLAVNTTFSIFNSGGRSTNRSLHGGFTLINANLEAKNIRYCVHDEHGGDLEPYYSKYYNCEMYMDNRQNANWQNTQCIGGGLALHGEIVIENSFFRGEEINNNLTLVSYHNSGIDAANPSKSNIAITGCYFEGSKATALFTSYGTYQTITKCLISNCSMGKAPSCTTDSKFAENMMMYDWNNHIRN